MAWPDAGPGVRGRQRRLCLDTTSFPVRISSDPKVLSANPMMKPPFGQVYSVTNQVPAPVVALFRRRKVHQAVADLHVGVADLGGKVGCQIAHDPVSKLGIGLAEH